jgi:AraC-like DNA-binding protein
MSHIRYEINLQNVNVRLATLLYVSHSVYEQEWHSTLHSHQCVEVFYITTGKGQFHIEDMVFPVEAGNIIIINPQIDHTESGDDMYTFEYTVLGINCGGFWFDEGAGARYIYYKNDPPNPKLQHYVHEIEAEVEKGDPFCEIVANNLTTMFLVELLRNKTITKIDLPTQKANRECANIKRYIDTHYSESISLQALASMAHLNKYYLLHAFLKEYGISPINYLLKRRIEESCNLLKNTDHSISQISQILGFSSSSYFSQRFRQAENISPKEYRQKNAVPNL